MTRKCTIFVVVAIAVGLILGIMITTDKPCNWTPYDEDCVCEDGFLKKQVETSNDDRYYCELENLFYDPQNPNFANAVTDHAKIYLKAIHLGCVSSECSPEIGNIEVDLGQAANGDRKAIIECNGLETWWKVIIDIETGYVDSSQCLN